MTACTTGTVRDKKILENKGWICIDVTVKNAKGKAKSLAPTWEMVLNYKNDTMSWDEYTTKYNQIIKQSQKQYPNTWKGTLKLEKIAFLCFCKYDQNCHRHLLLNAFQEFAKTQGLSVTPFPEQQTTNTKKPVEEFQKEYRFLSNFWPAEIAYEGLSYPSTEHAFQAAKTKNLSERKEIQKARTPGIAKRLGKKVSLRSDWKEIRLDIMFRLNYEKYTRHPHLTKQLLETENRDLIEGNKWHDYFWGQCNGKGENNLGKILMRIRKELGE